jgi:IclR family negative regulator of allantoin and glyoxylate utilization operon
MERDILGLGLRIIEQLGDSAQPVGVRELSRTLDIPVGTTHRVLQALKRERLVEQAGERGLYRSGLRIAELSRRILRANDLVPTALPSLHEAVERSGDSVAVMVVEGNEAVCAASVECDQLLRVVFPAGWRGPLHRGASGRLLLAFEPEDKIRAIVKIGARAARPNRIEDPDAFITDLDALRKRGYSVSHGEREEGFTSVAATVRGPDGAVIASVAIYGPHSRFSARADLTHHMRTVRECAAAIEAALAQRQHRGASRVAGATTAAEATDAARRATTRRVRRTSAATRVR